MQEYEIIFFNRKCNEYGLSHEDMDYLEKIVLPIILNPNFKKRMTSEYSHHGSITLGEHILEDTIVTYKLAKKEKIKHNGLRIDLAVKISLFHDLYTMPWQNNKNAKVKHFFDKHGFRHPVESVINSISWYKEIFNDNDSPILIDGILHHMFPFPVRNLSNKAEIKNRELYYKLDDKYKDIISNSLKRKKIGPISFTRSKYIEGRIMAKADRLVSRKQIRDLSSFKALFTGHNKKIK